MIKINLARNISDERVTLGQLFIDDGAGPEPWLVTLENRWADNRPNVSCIPAGTYICRRIVSPKYGVTFEVTDVQGRTHILFHWGNYPDDTLGCILLGITSDPAMPAVWHSKNAFAEFMQRLDGVDEFELEILDVDYQEAA